VFNILPASSLVEFLNRDKMTLDARFIVRFLSFLVRQLSIRRNGPRRAGESPANGGEHGTVGPLMALEPGMPAAAAGISTAFELCRFPNAPQLTESDALGDHSIAACY
jgi:hypothetical protein